MGKMDILAVDVASLLIDIEALLRQLGHWQSEQPAPQALASREPFCIDTLTFPQWLQFVFLPRMHELVEQQQALPQSCAIAPMAAEYFKGKSKNTDTNQLLATLMSLDKLLSANRA